MDKEKLLQESFENELPGEVSDEDVSLVSQQEESEVLEEANNTEGLFLVSRQPNSKLTKHKLEEGVEVVVGASSDCDILVLDDDFLSGKHFAIKLKGGKIHVRDLNSTNGLHLRINDQNVSKDEELLAGVTSFTFEECDG